jgi:hypothetical protein
MFIYVYNYYKMKTKQQANIKYYIKYVIRRVNVIYPAELL